MRQYEPGSALRERAPQRERSGREIAQDYFSLDTNDAVAGTRELAVAARVSRV